jgi:hypothetical protein
MMFFFRMLLTKYNITSPSQSPLSQLAELEACVLMLKFSCFQEKENLSQIFDIRTLVHNFSERIRTLRKKLHETHILKYHPTIKGIGNLSPTSKTFARLQKD